MTTIIWILFVLLLFLSLNSSLRHLQMSTEAALAALRANNAKIDAMTNQVAKVASEITRLIASIPTDAIDPAILAELQAQTDKLGELGIVVAAADALNADTPETPANPV